MRSSEEAKITHRERLAERIEKITKDQIKSKQINEKGSEEKNRPCPRRTMTTTSLPSLALPPQPSPPPSPPPDEFVCPLTLEVMDVPMMDRYGHNFERSAILEWLDRDNNRCCPLTRRPMSLRDLVTNRPLQAKIDFYKYQQRQRQLQRQQMDTTASTSTYRGIDEDYLDDEEYDDSAWRRRQQHQLEGDWSFDGGEYEDLPPVYAPKAFELRQQQQRTRTSATRIVWEDVDRVHEEGIAAADDSTGSNGNSNDDTDGGSVASPTTRTRRTFQNILHPSRLVVGQHRHWHLPRVLQHHHRQQQQHGNNQHLHHHQ